MAPLNKWSWWYWYLFFYLHPFLLFSFFSFSFLFPILLFSLFALFLLIIIRLEKVLLGQMCPRYQVIWSWWKYLLFFLLLLFFILFFIFSYIFWFATRISGSNQPCEITERKRVDRISKQIIKRIKKQWRIHVRPPSWALKRRWRRRRGRKERKRKERQTWIHNFWTGIKTICLEIRTCSPVSLCDQH